MTDMKVTTKNGHLKPHYRPTWAEVDLKAIEHNYKQVRRLVGKDTNIMVVVKANAYGHGAIAVAKVLGDAEAFALEIDEGLGRGL